ncbi:2'-5' RNA ligase family protein [Euhalothece natronophila Z-M001]|uniref:2'-5' RNA ligase family protein n=1 Tax=Euhalothece natronophila Z-M001 TaxID=522448 RepID=A0A5B8NTC6_9CHRO|nr:2'-5' RNA ligase family protein [Euhalothece natronophila]QDZ41290.1 2'-5' RNA ligase family protein [Euhalothece natronophila Z-M001]
MSNKQLCFIALLPPPIVQAEANAIKDHFATAYESSHAKNSPPHITLQPPFKWNKNELSHLKTTLRDFSHCQPAIPVTLSGFGAFPPRVIYIHVEKTPELLKIQSSLLVYLEQQLGLVDSIAQSRPFVPHMTVAFRDLSKANFHQAWQFYKQQPFEYQFTVNELTLLLHNGKFWEIEETFSFSPNI